MAAPETSLAYRALVHAVDRVLPWVARAGPIKLSEGDRERRLALARWERWGREQRDPARPLVWCHAPSVGEGLQAEAVLRLLRSAHPDWQIAFSFYSPSAVALASRQPVDAADYLPYDTRTNVAKLLRALRPTALVFTKLDLWPELATRARAAGVRVGMIAATVSPVSGRLRSPARRLAAPGYAALDLVGAIAAPDADRLVALGARRDGIAITGDPRFDSAWRRARAVAPDDRLLQAMAGALTLVAGSTWPSDEGALLDAFTVVRATHPAARLVLAPHEPTPDQLAQLETQAWRRGLDPTRLADVRGPASLIIVDRVGVLATLYCGAALAYVGGGFGTAGLHSVLEPAACGIPVLFGPNWRSSREAGTLLEAGAALALPRDREESAAQLARTWQAWLDRPDERADRGRHAVSVVERELGADRRSAELVETLMAGSPASRLPTPGSTAR